MDLDKLKFLWRSDLHRYGGASGPRAGLATMLREPGFKYTFWMRAVAALREAGAPWRPAYVIARLVLKRYERMYGIAIPAATRIGSGLYVGHHGGIVVNSEAALGRNCNISQGVTIGQSNRGARKGVPSIGDNVYMGPGAKLVGAIRVGSNVAVGANCVVTDDVPDNGVVVGVPGRVISDEGAAGYVEFTDYE